MKKTIFICLAVLFLYSCQTVPYARDVKRKPRHSGVIALKSNFQQEDRQKAESMMQSNCAPESYGIIEEGEVVTGQETKSTSNETNREDSRHNVGDLFGIPVVSGTAAGKETQQSSLTTQLKEWQILYECQSSKAKKKL